MRLFIRIKDGLPFEHPIMEDNFVQAYPNIDINNLPPEFAVFERIERPSLNAYEVYEGLSYVFDNGVVKDLHHVRPMTVDEKKEYDAQQLLSQPFPSWVFNSETMTWEPPVPYPENGFWDWNEEKQEWVEISPFVAAKLIPLNN